MSESSSNKRKDEVESGESSDSSKALVVKKQRTAGEQAVVAHTPASSQLILPPGVSRTSNLQAPIMILSGHQAEVMSMKFSSSGEHLASGGVDKQIFLWNVYGDCDNYAVLKGHSNSILEVAWFPDSRNLISASTDKSVALWDCEEGYRVRKTHHASFVNCCAAGRNQSNLYVSGSDDGMIKLWDRRSKGCVQTYTNKYSVLSVALNNDSTQIFSGGLDNVVKIWDMRQGSLFLNLPGHVDSITGLRLSPDGNQLLTNSMDNTVRIWDVKPYCNTDRCLKVFVGAQHNFEKTLLRCSWSGDASKVAAASADRFVYIWDTASRRILYKLPGHKGSVNEVDFHPKEPIIGSCSNDHVIYLGEINPTPTL